jgi:hypothetical protein
MSAPEVIAQTIDLLFRIAFLDQPLSIVRFLNRIPDLRETIPPP